jgi:SnoaL-like domain
MRPERQRLIRSLFDEYLERYSSRDGRLTSRFSENFSGYTGSGNFLVQDMDEWRKITCLDFSQVPGRIRIELLDITMLDLSDDVVAVTSSFHIHLPIPEHILSRETARKENRQAARAGHARCRPLQALHPTSAATWPVTAVSTRSLGHWFGRHVARVTWWHVTEARSSSCC